jgi:hypothetical protein
LVENPVGGSPRKDLGCDRSFLFVGESSWGKAIANDDPRSVVDAKALLGSVADPKRSHTVDNRMGGEGER